MAAVVPIGTAAGRTHAMRPLQEHPQLAGEKATSIAGLMLEEDAVQKVCFAQISFIWAKNADMC